MVEFIMYNNLMRWETPVLLLVLYLACNSIYKLVKKKFL